MPKCDFCNKYIEPKKVVKTERGMVYHRKCLKYIRKDSKRRSTYTMK